MCLSLHQKKEMVTTLTFAKIENGYESQVVTVTSDFNLHLERESRGAVYIFQRTDGNKFGYGTSFDAGNLWKDLDVDLDARLYPKDIKIVSSSAVTYGSISQE